MQRKVKEDEFELIPIEFSLVEEFGFRSDTRDPRKKDGTFESGFRTRASKYDTYSKGYSLVLQKNENILTDEMIKRNKLYIYQTNDVIMFAVKNEQGEIIRKPLKLRNQNIANNLLGALHGTQLLSLEDEKAIFKTAGFERHIIEPTYRKQKITFGMTPERSFGEITVPLDDIDPDTAVSVTKIFDCAPIFPVGKEYENQTEIWINVVYVHTAFLTYKEQLRRQSDSIFCMEMAMRDIPSNDVLCAIKCKRYFTPNVLISPVGFSYKDGMYYELIGDIVWNPKLANVQNRWNPILEKFVENPSFTAHKAFITKLIEARKNKFIVCPINLNLTVHEKEQVQNGTYPSSLKLNVMTEKDHTINEIFRAIYIGDVALLQNLLISREGINLNVFENRSSLSPLHLAVLNGNFKMVDLLLKHGANINIIDPIGYTSPLSIAINNNHKQIAIYLINRGDINIHQQDIKGYSLLDCAIYQNSSTLVKMLLENGAKITDHTLAIAEKTRVKDSIKNVLNKIYQYQLGNDLLNTVKNNDVKMIKKLVKIGANINQPYFSEGANTDISLLDLALHRNQFTTVLSLLELGINACTYPSSHTVILLHTLLKDESLRNEAAKSDLADIASYLKLKHLIIPSDKQKLILDLIKFSNRPSLEQIKLVIIKKMLIALVTNKDYKDIEFSPTELACITKSENEKGFLFKLIKAYKELAPIELEINRNVKKFT